MLARGEFREKNTEPHSQGRKKRVSQYPKGIRGGQRPKPRIGSQQEKKTNQKGKNNTVFPFKEGEKRSKQEKDNRKKTTQSPGRKEN